MNIRHLTQRIRGLLSCLSVRLVHKLIKNFRKNYETLRKVSKIN